MKVYTRTGDDGTTGLFGGDRVAKSHPRISAYGTVDETNSCLGLARSYLECSVGPRGARWQTAVALLSRVQNELFVLGGDLASPHDTKYPVPRIEARHVEALETDIDHLTRDLAELKHFILPGGTPTAAALHQARTVSRRAERLAVETAALEGVSEHVLHYLNRLSDFLFTLARWVNADAKVEDIAWVPVADRSE